MDVKKMPVLLTSSITAHDPRVSLTDPNERLVFALQSIAQWLQIDQKIPIVLCDGSGFDFTPLIAEQFPSANIECISFFNNQERVRLQGRGYGEGEIVRYAIEHSNLIAIHGAFAKCTSKLWVENYHECLSHWNGNFLFKGIFLNAFSPVEETEFSYIDTRFYIVRVAAYRDCFESAHLMVNTETGHSLEDCFFDIFLQRHITAALFPVPPIIAGVGGGIGVSYRNSIHRRIKERLRLRMVRTIKRFSHLFPSNL